MTAFPELPRMRMPLLTLVFAVALIGVYVWQGMTLGRYTEFSAEALMALGANVPAYSLSDQSYRLLTNLFLHGSITHLLFNVVALLLIGSALEAVIRRWQWQWAQAHPQRQEIRAATDALLADWRQQELVRQAQQAREDALRDEASEQPAPVDPQAAAGHVIDVPGVVAIVASEQADRLYLAANGAAGAQVLEYDLASARVLRTVAQVPYADGEAWSCPFPKCMGVGIVGLDVDEKAGKAYTVGLVKGAFSRIDLASGAIDYSVPVPSAEQARNQFLVHEGRAYVATNPGVAQGDYAMYRPEMLLTEIDIAAGSVLRQLAAPPIASHLDPMMPMTIDMVWSSGTQSLYLLDPVRQLTRFDPVAGRFDAPIPQPVYAIGVDRGGQLWALDPAGVQYPGTARAARTNVAYRPRSSDRQYLSDIYNPVLGATDQRSPLIVLGGGSKQLFAISVLTGKVLRAYPIRETEQAGFRLKTLGPGHVYVLGDAQAQLIDLDKAMAPGEHGAGFERGLQR